MSTTMLCWKYSHCRISTSDIIHLNRGSLIPLPKNCGSLGISTPPDRTQPRIKNLFMIGVFWFVRPWLRNQSHSTHTTSKTEANHGRCQPRLLLCYLGCESKASIRSRNWNNCELRVNVKGNCSGLPRQANSFIVHACVGRAQRLNQWPVSNCNF